MIQSSYLSEVFNPSTYTEVIRKVRMKLRNIKYDTIAFRGISGAAVAFPLAAATGKNLICVRKVNASHCHLNVEGCFVGKRYIIVDDFIISGDTLKEIKSSIEEEFKKNSSTNPECVAVLFYKEHNPYAAPKKVKKIYPKTKVLAIDCGEYEGV